MSKLIFDAAELKVLCDHAKSCKTHAAGYAHLTEAKYLKDGASIPLGMFEQALVSGPKTITANLTAKRISVEYQAPAPTQKTPGRANPQRGM